MPLLFVLSTGCASMAEQLVAPEPAERLLAAQKISSKARVRAKADELPELLQALQDPQVEVQVAAARLLGALTDPQALQPLFEACGEQPEILRVAAGQALAAYDDETLQRPFQRRLRSADPLQRLSASCPARYGQSETLQRQGLSLLTDPDERVRQEAMALARQLGAAALPELFLALRVEVSGVQATAIIREIGLPDAIFTDLPEERATLREVHVHPPFGEHSMLGAWQNLAVSWRGSPGRLVAYDFVTERRAWSHPLETAPDAALITAQGQLHYVHGERLVALAAEEGAERWSLAIEDCAGPALDQLGDGLLLRCADRGQLLESDTGKTIWTHHSSRHQPRPLFLPGLAVQAERQPQTEQLKLKGSLPGAEEPKWTAEHRPQQGWVALHAGLVCARDAKGRLLAYDVDNGRLRWQGGALPAEPLLASYGGLLHAQTRAGHLVTWQANDGKELWISSETYPQLEGLFACRGGLYCVFERGARIERLEAATGELLAREESTERGGLLSSLQGPDTLNLLFAPEKGPYRIVELDTGYGPLVYRGIQAMRDVQLLIELVSTESPRVRYRAAVALGEIGGQALKPALPALLEALNEEDPRARGAVFYALGRSGLEEVIEPLAKLLTREQDNRKQLVSSLDALDRRFLTRPEVAAIKDTGLRQLRTLDNLFWNLSDLESKIEKNRYCKIKLQYMAAANAADNMVGAGHSSSAGVMVESVLEHELLIARLPREEVKWGEAMLERQAELIAQVDTSFLRLSPHYQAVARALAARRGLDVLPG